MSLSISREIDTTKSVVRPYTLRYSKLNYPIKVWPVSVIQSLHLFVAAFIHCYPFGKQTFDIDQTVFYNSCDEGRAIVHL